MNSEGIKKVVIAGGGTAGWMVAALLSKTMGKVLDISLIESDEIGTVGVGEATIPPLVQYNQLCQINEKEFMAAVQATFKLGISFENWRDVNEDYIHSFGNTGTDHWSAGFQHIWLTGKRKGLARDTVTIASSFVPRKRTSLPICRRTGSTTRFTLMPRCTQSS